MIKRDVFPALVFITILVLSWSVPLPIPAPTPRADVISSSDTRHSFRPNSYYSPANTVIILPSPTRRNTCAHTHKHTQSESERHTVLNVINPHPHTDLLIYSPELHNSTGHTRTLSTPPQCAITAPC
uniref:Secreted protein n=1 Tax=Oncorhynchus mykiss TaxID=8022 RepID=A0A8K9XL19_ONCMY